jgi:hypothetical protein
MGSTLALACGAPQSDVNAVDEVVIEVVIEIVEDAEKSKMDTRTHDITGHGVIVCHQVDSFLARRATTDCI